MNDRPDGAPQKKLREPVPHERRIYPLTRLLLTYEDDSTETITPTPEQIAVAIAKCSRSEAPFDQNVHDVSLEKAAEFHEKWVVGYGHSSVAEHAVASVAFERISQVVIKILEDSRLASYTEKSSRYVVFSRERVVLPQSLREGVFGQRVSSFFDRLYALYDTIYERVYPLMVQRFPKSDEMPDRAYAAVTKARACDVARYCLPAAAAGNLGITCNARTWAHIITKLASSPHTEAQEVATELIRHLRANEGESADEALNNRLFPSLLKYAGYNPYLAGLTSQLTTLEHDLLPATMATVEPQATFATPVVLIRDDAFAELRIATALMARVSRKPIACIQQYLQRHPEYIERILRDATKNRSDFDQLPREFEHAVFQHEIVMDYGAWRDVQRHRMCTQLNQHLGVDLGYVVPHEIEAVGLELPYQRIMEEASALYTDLMTFGHENDAEYIVPMAYRRRLIITWNARELDHFITLRSGKKGHPSYRHIAQETWHTLQHTHPLLADIIRVDLSGNDEGLSTLGAKPKGF